jgi:hypothetical protein
VAAPQGKYGKKKQLNDRIDEGRHKHRKQSLLDAK